jgi:protein-disulfide isomerase
LGKKERLTETGCSKQTRATWPLLAALVLIVLLAAVSCGGAASEQRAKETAENEQASAERSQAETGEPQGAGARLGHPSLGEEDAPVVITEYADYQ